MFIFPFFQVFILDYYLHNVVAEYTHSLDIWPSLTNFPVGYFGLNCNAGKIKERQGKKAPTNKIALLHFMQKVTYQGYKGQGQWS